MSVDEVIPQLSREQQHAETYEVLFGRKWSRVLIRGQSAIDREESARIQYGGAAIIKHAASGIVIWRRSMKHPTIGQLVDGGADLQLDLTSLLETRMLIQANSGGGKSWAIRRVLEQTAGKVQQLVIDMEGEFSTLREKFDFVIAAARDGDAVANPRSAELLARRLLETRVSAILDIYELKPHERQAFVRRFLEAMVNAPKELWQPTLVVLDEAHVFCPEGGKAEAAGAVIDLATRGRKRGYALIAATQRMAKFNKDCAAELLNKLVGRAGLDVDVKRAADDLGFTAKEAMLQLRNLDAGEFFAFGPALCRAVTKVKVGTVETSHPKAGDRLLRAPPKPTAAIKAVLPKLKDLPKEAEQELRTADDLRRELAKVRGELTKERNARPVESASREQVAAAEARGKTIGRIEARRELRLVLPEFRKQLLAAVKDAASQVSGDIEGHIAGFVAIASRTDEPDRAAHIPAGNTPARKIAAPPENPASQGISVPRRENRNDAGRARLHRQIDGGAASELQPVQQRILDSLAELEQLGAKRPTRELAAFMSGYSNVTSKGFANAIGALRTAGLIDHGGGAIFLTDAGCLVARPPDRPRTAAELQERIVTMLGGASGKILAPLIEAYPEALPRTEVAESAGYGNVTSKGFANAIGRLRTLGFIDYPDRGSIVAKPVLFLEGTP